MARIDVGGEMNAPLATEEQVFRLPAAQELLDARNEIERLRRELQHMTDLKDAVNETLGKVVAERNALRTELREIADVMERDGRFAATVKAIRQTVTS